MVHDIRGEFDNILESIDWMDDLTKSRAKEKAAYIVEHIGYPSELMQVSKLGKNVDILRNYRNLLPFL